MTKWDLFQECNVGIYNLKINVMHHINRIENKEYLIISIDTEKPFDKI